MQIINEMMSTKYQYKVICISTAHILEEDAERLREMGEGDHMMILSRDTGAFVKIYPVTDGEERHLEEDYPGFSDAFYTVLRLAREAGFEMVEFDQGATEYDSLAAFDW